MRGLDQLQYNKADVSHLPRWSVWGLGFSVWPYRAVRIILSAVFFWSGVSKLLSPESFAVIIEAYGIVPDGWVTPMSMGLPILEVILALGLLLDIRGSLSGTAALLALFMAILGYGIHMGLDLDCGCFGPEDPEALNARFRLSCFDSIR